MCGYVRNPQDGPDPAARRCSARGPQLTTLSSSTDRAGTVRASPPR